MKGAGFRTPRDAREGTPHRVRRADGCPHRYRPRPLRPAQDPTLPSSRQGRPSTPSRRHSAFFLWRETCAPPDIVHSCVTPGGEGEARPTVTHPRPTDMHGYVWQETTVLYISIGTGSLFTGSRCRVVPSPTREPSQERQREEQAQRAEGEGRDVPQRRAGGDVHPREQGLHDEQGEVTRQGAGTGVLVRDPGGEEHQRRHLRPSTTPPRATVSTPGPSRARR